MAFGVGGNLGGDQLLPANKSLSINFNFGVSENSSRGSRANVLGDCSKYSRVVNWRSRKTASVLSDLSAEGPLAKARPVAPFCERRSMGSLTSPSGVPLKNNINKTTMLRQVMTKCFRDSKAARARPYHLLNQLRSGVEPPLLIGSKR